MTGSRAILATERDWTADRQQHFSFGQLIGGSLVEYSTEVPLQYLCFQLIVQMCVKIQCFVSDLPLPYRTPPLQDSSRICDQHYGKHAVCTRTVKFVRLCRTKSSKILRKSAKPLSHRQQLAATAQDTQTMYCTSKRCRGSDSFKFYHHCIRKTPLEISYSYRIESSYENRTLFKMFLIVTFHFQI